MTRISTGCRIALRQSARHEPVWEGSREASVAFALKFVIPSRDRKPHFDPDIGITRRLQRRGNAAECRQFFIALHGIWAEVWFWRDKLAGPHTLRHGDFGSGQLQAGQALTGRGVSVAGACEEGSRQE